MRAQGLVVCLLLVASFAHADRGKAKKKAPPVVARVVGLEVSSDEGHDSSLVTILAGSDRGIQKGWHAHFRDGTTDKPLSGGDAYIVRLDKRSTILKTDLSAEQVRANKLVELGP